MCEHKGNRKQNRHIQYQHLSPSKCFMLLSGRWTLYMTKDQEDNGNININSFVKRPALHVSHFSCFVLDLK